MKVFIVRLHLRLRLLLCMLFKLALVWIYPVTHDMGRKIRILDSGAEFAFVTKVPTSTGEDFGQMCWYRRPELFTPFTCQLFVIQYIRHFDDEGIAGLASSLLC